MTRQKLIQHIDEMRERVRQTAISEQSLVKDLADSLKILDQQLLQNVRQVAIDHQARRGSILNALEDLADSMGMFRLQHEVAAPSQSLFRKQSLGRTQSPRYRNRSTMGINTAPPTGAMRQRT